MTRAEAFAQTYAQLRDRYRAAFPNGAPPSQRASSRTGSPDLLARLRAIQGTLCPICGGRLPPMGNACPKGDAITFDHVWPRRPAKGRQGPHHGNLVAAHNRCNNRKSNRPPTGCEIVWLTAVNARLGIEPRRAA